MPFELVNYQDKACAISEFIRLPPLASATYQVLYLKSSWESATAEQLIALFQAPHFRQVTHLDISNRNILASIKLSEAVLSTLPSHITTLDISFDFFESRTYRTRFHHRAHLIHSHFFPATDWFAPSIKTLTLHCKPSTMSKACFEWFLIFLSNLPQHIEEVNVVDILDDLFLSKKILDAFDATTQLTHDFILAALPKHIKHYEYVTKYQNKPEFLSENISRRFPRGNTLLHFQRLSTSEKSPYYQAALTFVILGMSHNPALEIFKALPSAIIRYLVEYIGGENDVWQVTQPRMNEPTQEIIPEEITNAWRLRQSRQAYGFLSQSKASSAASESMSCSSHCAVS